MGWTYSHRNKGITTREYLAKEFGEEYKIVDMAMDGRTAYLAVKHEDKIFGVVVLTNWSPRSYFNFGTKHISEDMGPCEADCPERILKQLTPIDSQWANEWRARCWANLAKTKDKPKLRVGSLIKFDKPLKFTSGYEYQTFEIRDLRKLLAVVVTPFGYGCRVKLRRDILKFNPYQVVA